MAKKKQSLESLQQPKLSPEEAAKVKGGLLSITSPLSPTLKPAPLPSPLPGLDPSGGLPRPGVNPLASDACKETGDSGMMGCPG